MKQIKIKIILLILTLSSIASIKAQYSVDYKYDNNGNRIQRYFVGLIFRAQINMTSQDSIKEIDKLRMEIMKKGLSVFPNPVKDNVNISFSKIVFDQEANKVDVYLTDALGKSLQKTEFKGEDVSFNMESYLPGIYYLGIVINDKEKFEYKIVKVNP
jgi:hypothetical protein